MSKTMRNRIIVAVLRALPTRAVRRFVRHQEGVAAVEFSFIAIPFLALLFAILETALVFFAGQTLEAATADAARLILTGQAQTTVSPDNGKMGFDQTDFKNAVCARVASMFDCANSIYINVNSYSAFASVDTSTPMLNGNFDASVMQYKPGGPGDIVIVQVFYQWKLYVSLLDMNLANASGNNRLLVATAVFRNEPYVPATNPGS